MKILGEANSFAFPTIRANGVPVDGVFIENTSGGIPTAVLSMPPEFLSSFKDGEIVTVQVNSSDESVNVFRGVNTGFNFSNMDGGISAGINLIHESHVLDKALTTMPGITPGSPVDRGSTLYFQNQEKASVGSASVHSDYDFKVDTREDFGQLIIDALVDIVTKEKESKVEGFQIDMDAQNEAAQFLSTKVKSKTGPLNVGANFEKPINSYLNEILFKGGTSNTVWDMLAVILGAFDCTTICLPNGEVRIVPDLSGLRGPQSPIEIPNGLFQKFDYSSKTHRLPRFCYIMAPLTFGQDRNKLAPAPMGKAEIDNPEAAGALLLSPPGWMTRLASIQVAAIKESINKLAKTIADRESTKLKTSNLMCIPILNAIPGYLISFKPFSSVFAIKSQNPNLGQEFSGCVWKVAHSFSASAPSNTVLYVRNLTGGTSSAGQSHPLFESPSLTNWDDT